MNASSQDNELPEVSNSQVFQVEPAGWLCLAEYGDWPHTRGLQRFTRESAERMCAYFRSLRGRLARKFGGLPVYVGHPDDPHFAGQSGHGDTRAYAWIADLDAREDGLYALPRWSDEGRKLLSNAFYKFLSPRWAMRELGGGVFEPVRLLSVGLTNQPNIPGQTIANETKHEHPPTTGLEPTLDDVLAALGLDKAVDPIHACEALREECDFLRQSNEELTAENERFYRLASDHDAARERAEDALTQERRQRISLLLDQAEAQGRILPNEREARLAELEENLPHGLTRLCEAKPALKTRCLSNGLGLRKQPLNRRDAFLALVNERTLGGGTGFAEAWNQVKQERPELFEQLKSEN